MTPTAAVSKPATLADPLVLALVAYIAAVPGALAYAAWNVAVQPRRSAAVLPLVPSSPTRRDPYGDATGRHGRGWGLYICKRLIRQTKQAASTHILANGGEAAVDLIKGLSLV